MTAFLDEIREKSKERISSLQSDLVGAQKIIGNKGCIFATGSFGRLEAGADSDLDVFVVIKTYMKEIAGEKTEIFRLKETEQICLKNDLIISVRKAGIAEFDSGGKYLITHRYNDFVRYLGSPEDDYLNTFTGRMLLLLESNPIIGNKSYDQLLEIVVNAYFTDYAGNEDNFVPAFLFNDILRMWRTFCVNYEYFRNKGGGDWRIKNLKLKYFRILTCFSAIAHILAYFSLHKTVSPSSVLETARLTPALRLSNILDEAAFGTLQNYDRIQESARSLLAEYSDFLQLNHESKEEALRNFEENEDQWRQKSHGFGAEFANLLNLVAGGNALQNNLFRSIIV